MYGGFITSSVLKAGSRGGQRHQSAASMGWDPPPGARLRGPASAGGAGTLPHAGSCAGQLAGAGLGASFEREVDRMQIACKYMQAISSCGTYSSCVLPTGRGLGRVCIRFCLAPGVPRLPFSLQTGRKGGVVLDATLPKRCDLRGQEELGGGRGR